MPGEDKDQKTEEPTAKRLEEALKEGQFAKAPEIQMTFMMVAAFFVLLFYATSVAQQFRDFAVSIFSHIGDIEVAPENVTQWFNTLYKLVIQLVAPIMMACTGASMFAGGLQSGFRLTPKVLAWKPERLNPVKGFQNQFAKQKLADFLVEFMKFAAVLLIVINGIYVLIEDPIFHHPVTPHYVLQFIHKIFLVIFIRLIVALAIIAFINYLFQKQKTRSMLKMTKQEVKDERKSAEGDPMVKGRQRQLARSLMQRQMLDAVPNADVVVTNPTHFAVALKYDRDEDEAPVILAKGQNLFAKRIKAIAKEHEVPMIENKPVAQMLFKMGKVGNSIPYELYQVVAEILASVYKTHRYYFHKLKARRRELRTAQN